MVYFIFSGGIRLIRSQAENVQSKTSGINQLNSLDKSSNYFERNRFYSTILSSNWKSTDRILNKNTSIVDSKIM